MYRSYIDTGLLDRLSTCVCKIDLVRIAPGECALPASLDVALAEAGVVLAVLVTAERGAEGVAVVDWHDVVEDGVDGGREVVEAARHVVEPLVDNVEVSPLATVDVEQALGVERCPAQEECDHYCSCKTIYKQLNHCYSREQYTSISTILGVQLYILYGIWLSKEL